MRILHITPEAPGMLSGGQQGVLQSVKSLTGCAVYTDYIGPRIENQNIKKLYRKTIELEPVYDIFHILGTLFHGETNKRFYSWKRLLIDYGNYDCIFMDF